ncbi:hypothetical protein [Mycolicibacterium sphagni]|uniref:hypothetical protein n=1 Tax=Mycolicibacterium sphagni TaxID=1786 RepID=UPI0021F2CCDB|nr:hypothetical protein [Mycolicibacterium sphagni]MCV7178583.1 hypothetical protein [Mycolicibacterium sphagni]
MALTKISFTTVFLTGAAAAAVAAAPLAAADPAGCINPDGSVCGAASAGPNGASGSIPGGPGGTAGPGYASGGIPNGPSGSAWPGGATGCIPYVGCATVGH